jgi:EmrB/QacA subfamily drug resistance transporter
MTAAPTPAPAEMDDTARARAAWRIFSVTSLGVLLCFINSSTLNVALPAVTQALGAGPTAASWILLSYMLVNTVLILVFGRLADLVGRRALYLAGLVVFTLGSLGCGLAVSPEMLIAFRVVQAAGGAAIVTNTTALLTDAFPPRLLGTGLGLNASMAACSQVLGPLVGGAMVVGFGWRAVFLFNIPLGLVALVWAAVTLRRLDSKGTGERFDLLGGLLSLLLLGGLALTLSLGGAWGWGHPLVVFSIGVAAAALPAFLLTQAVRPDPLVDLKLFADRDRGIGYASVLLLPAAQTAFILLVALFLQAAQGKGPLQAGAQVSVTALGMMVAAPLAGRLLRRMGATVLTRLGLGLAVAGTGGLAATIGTAMPPLLLMLWMLLLGLGTGLFMTPNTSAIMTSVPPARRGIANGVRSMLQNSGGLLGTALALSIVTAPLSPASRQAVYAGRMSGFAPAEMAALVGGYRNALWVLCGLCLLALALGMLRRGRAA